MIPAKDLLGFELGFYPTQRRSYGRQGTIRDGSGVWVIGDEGLITSDRGALASGATGGANPLMVIESGQGGPSGLGTITTGYGVKWIAGTGPFFFNGVNIGSPVGTQLSLIVGGVPVAAGLAAPGPPTVSVLATAGRLDGSYSVALMVYRQTTGALSSHGVASAVFAANSKKVRITFPAAPAGASHWIICPTFRRFGSTGPWYQLLTAAQTLTSIPVGTAFVDLDWADGELTDLAAINYDPSPTGVTHCVMMGGSMVAIVGNGEIYPSIVGRPEAFPLEFRSNLAVREPVTGCSARGLDGLAYLSTANSLHSLVSTGGDLTPVIPRGIWPDVGFAHGNAWCVAHDQIVGMSGQMGPVRTQGSEMPDMSFADPVLYYMKINGWTSANTYVVHAMNNGAVLFCKGAIALPYMIASGRWSAPIPLPGNVQAAVALNGKGYVAVSGTLYALDEAGAGGNWYVESPYMGGQNGHGYKTSRALYSTCNAPMTAKILINETGTAAITQACVAGHNGPEFDNTVNVRSFALRVEGTGGVIADGSGKSFESAEYHYDQEEIQHIAVA